MSTIRERCLRDLPHPNLNDVLKTNTHSAIKLLKTGKCLCYHKNMSSKLQMLGLLLFELS